jgi:hypothetical protein
MTSNADRSDSACNYSVIIQITRAMRDKATCDSPLIIDNLGFGRSQLFKSENSIFIIINTRLSCLEARCVCRQAAVKAAKILPLVGLARSTQDPINRGHGAQ